MFLLILFCRHCVPIRVTVVVKQSSGKSSVIEAKIGVDDDVPKMNGIQEKIKAQLEAGIQEDDVLSHTEENIEETISPQAKEEAMSKLQKRYLAKEQKLQVWQDLQNTIDNQVR